MLMIFKDRKKERNRDREGMGTDHLKLWESKPNSLINTQRNTSVFVLDAFLCLPTTYLYLPPKPPPPIHVPDAMACMAISIIVSIVPSIPAMRVVGKNQLLWVKKMLGSIRVET